MGVKINLERDALFSDQALALAKYYVRNGETSPQQAFARAAECYSKGDEAFAQRIYDYVSRQWFMFASPVLSNAYPEGQKADSLPISCFLSYVPDTRAGLVEHQSELAWLTLMGGGVGGHWSDVRAVSKKAPGPLPFIGVVDRAMLAYKQGETRKGAYAAYLDISHPDVSEFINVRVPTGGDINRKFLNIHNALNITDDFMKAVFADQSWDLVCPQTKEVRDTLPARQLWERILEIRGRTGEPYLNFIDTANRFLHPQLAAKGLKIRGSNLCNEIHLPTDENRTAVCCLSSLNLEKWDEFKDDPLFIEDLIRLLDNVLDVFIENAPDELSRARYSAERSRDIGLGAMGFHGLLMQKGIPFESGLATSLNRRVFSHIWEQAKAATRKLAVERGPAPDLVAERNAHLLAIAPNANSSIICGCTSSIEPINSNAYMHRTRAGAHMIRNPYLELVLEKLGQNTTEVWNSIVAHNGSVAHLEFMDEYTRDVFKTAFEIDQHWVVQHAADRQIFICQGQSVNLFFLSKADRAYVNSVHLRAWKNGLKGLYYLRTKSAAAADKVGVRITRVELNTEECLACHA